MDTTRRVYKTHLEFDNIYRDVVNRTMLAEPTLKMIYELAIAAELIVGDVAEAGVWAGGCSYLLASTMRTKEIHLLDSWEGLPRLDNVDISCYGAEFMPPGWGRCNPPYGYMKKFGDRIKFHKGWFHDTLNGISDKKFCLVHIDCDRYASVKECAEFFYPRMEKGGIIIFDDYTFIGTPGAIKAVDEFMKDKTFNTYFNGDGMVLVC